MSEPSAGRVELGKRLAEWIRVHRSNPRALATAAQMNENTVRRIVERPSYNPKAETWRQLAAYLNWDEGEVLMLAGHGPAPTNELRLLSSDPLPELQRLLSLGNVWPADAQHALLTLARLTMRGAV